MSELKVFELKVGKNLETGVVACEGFDVIKRVMNYIESKEHLYIEGKNV